jgi:hypothetical protein
LAAWVLLVDILKLYLFVGGGCSLSEEEDMSPSRYSKKTLVGLFCLYLALFLWVDPPKTTMAQCGDNPPASSCYTCHEQMYPVFGKGEWHEIHARKDCCWNCHGGNAQTEDKDLAHKGMTLQPLYNTYTDCYACHPDDYQARADRFGAALGVVPLSYAPVPTAPIPFTPNQDLQLVVLSTNAPAAAPSFPLSPELLCIPLGAALILGYYLWRKARRQAR